MNYEMRFVQDDDGHWYCINNEDLEEFNRLLDRQDYEQFNSKFSSFNCLHPSQYVITNMRNSL